MRKYIESYYATDEQEAADKDLMLYYIEVFDDLLTRENRIGHFTSSGFITNRTFDKILFVHHNIYKSWGWTGGHMDGDTDFLAVAIKEAKEETGLKNVEMMDEKIASLDILDVPGHFKNGAYVSAHVHLSLAYILIADDIEEVSVKRDENSGVKWFDKDKALDVVSEPHMRVVYEKLLDRIRKYEKSESM